MTSQSNESHTADKQSNQCLPKGAEKNCDKATQKEGPLTFLIHRTKSTYIVPKNQYYYNVNNQKYNKPSFHFFNNLIR